MWGRPRPIDIVDFNGSRPYHQVYQPAGPDMGKSFPSGHAAIGFYTIAPFFVLRRRKPRAALGLLLAGGGYGALMSVGRMLQGGHFLSDVLWSGYLVHMTGMLLYYLLHPDRFGDLDR
jgi:membrane-associated PAP2 superfamily phosphatase